MTIISSVGCNLSLWGMSGESQSSETGVEAEKFTRLGKAVKSGLVMLLSAWPIIRASEGEGGRDLVHGIAIDWHGQQLAGRGNGRGGGCAGEGGWKRRK